MENNSPWLSQLRFKRQIKKLSSDITFDSLIIGGGIAGIASAYFLLSKTEHSVALVEADKIAHGATGHNAGQVTSYFERHFVELVEEFGLEMACQGQAAVEGAWLLLEETISASGISGPLYQFTGYAGFSTLEQLVLRLEEEHLRVKGGLAPHSFLVVDDPLIILRIPDEYDYLYKAVTRSDLLNLLETTDEQYIGLKEARKGCLNSALFCEQIVEWLEERYPNRFSLFEETPVTQLVLGNTDVRAETDLGTISAAQVVLCTNGFESITIKNEVGLDINGRFHGHVFGTIGYMSGYLSDENKPPTALSFFEPSHLKRDDPYFYVTRRPQESSTGVAKNLICVGGPEVDLDDMSRYERLKHPYPQEAAKEIHSFMKRGFKDYERDMKFDFLWHGLMGYTKNGVRLIGFEPCNQRLLYNLGCNGVGILPSIYGGFRVASLIAGEQLSPSMFDVQDKRCSPAPL